MRPFLVSTFLVARAVCQTGPSDYVAEMSRRIFDNPHFGIVRWPTDENSAAQITREQVVAFLTNSGMQSVKTGDDVLDFRFAPLEPGKMYLVSVVNSGGSAGFVEISIIWCGEKSCTDDDLYSSGEIMLSDELISIADNGVFQIVTHSAIERTSVDPAPSKFTIYEMGHTAPYDASSKYRAWFDQRLYPKLKEQMNRKLDPGVFNADQIAHYHAAAQLAMDDYRERVLGVKGAMIADALEWASSPYSDVHALAIFTVESAADSPAAEKVLDALEKSSSPFIREESIRLRQERAERRAEKGIKR